MKPIRYLSLLALFAFGPALAAGVPNSQHKQKIDEDQAVELAAKALLAAPGLEFDTSFNSTGMKAFEPASPSGWSSIEDGVRVFPWTGSVTLPNPPIAIPVDLGYYVAVRQKNTSETQERLLMTRLNLNGSIDTSFGAGGWWLISTDTLVIRDVAMDDEGRVYVLRSEPGFVVVNCFSTTLSDCFDTKYPGSPPGAHSQSLATRLIWNKEYGLYVFGSSLKLGRGTMPWVGRMADAKTRDGALKGNLVTSFGDSGWVFGAPGWSASTGLNAAINAVAIRSTGGLSTQRLYIGGQANRLSGDIDGFIHALNPKTGQAITGWDWKSIFYEGDNTGNKNDAVTALTILSGGGSAPKLVYAGWSETDNTQAQPMIMGRFTSDGVWDTSFCAGNVNYSARACVVDPPWSVLGFFHTPSSVPVAIVERPNGDLAVAQRFQQNGGFVTNTDHHVRTLVQQFSQDGNRLYSALSVDYPGSSTNSANWWSRPFDMVKAGVVSNGLVLIGTRNWSSTDFDPTVTVLKGGEDPHVCLFSDGLENLSPACW